MISSLDSFVIVAAMPSWAKPSGLVFGGLLAALALGWLASTLLRLVLPKTAAVAWTTSKEAISQPLYWVLLVLGICALLLFPFVSYNTFGEDIKMLKDSGLTLIIVLAVIISVWTASVSVAEEIEGRIAVTVLSKPITRLEFIFGKFLGILAPTAVMFLVLGAVLLVTVAFKVVFDAHENALPAATTADCINEVVQTAPGLALGLMETIVLTAISLAISTRLPMIPNMIICASIYALGHLMPTLVHVVSQRDQAIPYFMAQLFAAVIPMLEYFSMSTAIASGAPVPAEYLGAAALYCAIYTAVAMLLALLLFEDRDLA